MKGTISEIWETVDQVVEENIEKILEDNDENLNTLENEIKESAELDQETVVDEIDANENIDQETIKAELIETEKNNKDTGIEAEDIEEHEELETSDAVEYNQVDWVQEFEKILVDYKPRQSYKTKIVETKSSSRAVKTALVVGGGIIILGLTVGGVWVFRNYRKRTRAEALPVTSEQPEIKEPILEPILEPLPSQPPQERVPHKERVPRPFFYFR